MLSLSLLISGALGKTVLQEIIESPFDLKAVFTDRQSLAIIEYCQQKDIPLFVGNPRAGKAQSFIQEVECDLILSVNYLFIIEKDLIDWPKRYAINIHGSLLPKYRGRTPHVWAIINGEKETGITAHLIDQEVDRGAILRQLKVNIDPEDTGAMILEKFHQLYPILVFDILHHIQDGNIQLKSQDPTKAFYFGKRTPADGQIDWNWSKERIKNWIRAQAHPYPGAFTFYNQQKVFIHRACFDDLGFQPNQDNGAILQKGPQHLIVKTPNGALRLEQIQTPQNISFSLGAILN